MPAGRPTKYKPEMCEQVIAMGKEGMSMHEMASELDIHIDTFIEWRKEKPTFSEAVKRAVDFSQAWWERKGREATFDANGFSATSYIFQMKNRFRENWNDTIKQETKVEMEVTSPKEALTEFLKAKSGNAS